MKKLLFLSILSLFSPYISAEEEHSLGILKALQSTLLNQFEYWMKHGNYWLKSPHNFIQNYFIETSFVVIWLLILFIVMKCFKYLDKDLFYKSKTRAIIKSDDEARHLETGKGVHSLRKALDDNVITETEFLNNVLNLTEEGKN